MNSPTVATGIQSVSPTSCIPLTSSKNFKSPSFKVWMYSTERMPPFSNAKSGPTLLPTKQLHTIIVVRLPLKRGTKQSGWCFSASVLNTHTGLELCPISMLLSSDQITLFQSSTVQFFASSANSKRCFICLGVKNGFATARCFWIPTSLRRRCKVRFEGLSDKILVMSDNVHRLFCLTTRTIVRISRSDICLAGPGGGVTPVKVLNSYRWRAHVIADLDRPTFAAIVLWERPAS